MNIAYLVLAHHQPLQLKRLIDRLNQPNVHFFVHIDKKSGDITPFADVLGNYKNVTLLSQYKVYWGGYSVVQTQLLLLRAAYQSDTQFKYYLFLSGQDYPIKSNEYINRFFERHNTDFIGFTNMEEMPEVFKNKYRYFHHLDSKYINPRDKGQVKLLYYIYHGFYRRLGKYIPHRKFYKNFIPYFGPDWFAFTHESVRYILEFSEKHRDYNRFMKYVEMPNEIYIHTLLLNSKRRHNIYGYESYVNWLKTKKTGEHFQTEYTSLRYMDWSERGPKHPKPAVLDISYMDTLKDDHNLFARKVDPSISSALMDQIDIEILGKK